MAGPHIYVISRREDDISEALDKLPAPGGPGQVLLKPNMLREAQILWDDEHEQVTTQPEVLVPVVRCARQRLWPNHLVLADVPEASADIGLDPHPYPSRPSPATRSMSCWTGRSGTARFETSTRAR